MEKAPTIGFGVHLPVMLHPGETPTLKALCHYAERAEALGYQAISANDHLVYRAPWLDSLTTLTAVCGATEKVLLATSILLLELRHPVVMAKVLATLDILSGGRLIVGVGAGSHEGDYQACGIPFQERWKRLDEGVAILRKLWGEERPTHPGPFHPFQDVSMEPRPLQQPGPPVWIGSWGSEAGLRRAARLGDGWMASAYNVTPQEFRLRWETIRTYAAQRGRDAATLGNALVTTFTYLTEDEDEAERMLTQVLGPALQRPPQELRERFFVGSVEDCVRKVAAYAQAGVQRIHIWPLVSPLDQITLFSREIMARFSQQSTP